MYPAEGLAEVVLVNDGETEMVVPIGIELEYEVTNLVAADSLRGFGFTGEGLWRNYLKYMDESELNTIGAGER